MPPNRAITLGLLLRESINSSSYFGTALVWRTGPKLNILSDAFSVRYGTLRVTTTARSLLKAPVSPYISPVGQSAYISPVSAHQLQPDRY